jgi:large subunit ribosomal protein L13
VRQKPNENRPMKTFSAKPETVKRDWYVIDAKDKVLGRLATELARRLKGKHKPEYTPHVDTGDYIVVIKPEQVIQLAVKGMLPKNPLGRAMLKKLRVFAGTEHPHAAQQPQTLEI